MGVGSGSSCPQDDSLQSCRRHYGNVGKFCKQGGGGETSVVAVQAVFELECLTHSLFLTGRIKSFEYSNDS